MCICEDLITIIPISASSCQRLYHQAVWPPFYTPALEILVPGNFAPRRLGLRRLHICADSSEPLHSSHTRCMDVDEEPGPTPELYGLELVSFNTLVPFGWNWLLYISSVILCLYVSHRFLVHLRPLNEDTLRVVRNKNKVERMYTVLSKQRITKAQIKLCRCTVWSIRRK